jgi:hypothetical protein
LAVSRRQRFANAEVPVAERREMAGVVLSLLRPGSAMPADWDDPKPRPPRPGAVREDGVSPRGARRPPADRLVDRPGKAGKEAPLETYEQPAARESDEPLKDVDGTVDRTARDEP